MADSTPGSLRDRNKQLARDMVLDAAERLLRKGESAEFSMRALAAEAGVGFATPFNHFGNKNAIMQGLSARLIARMAARFRDAAPLGDALDRVLAMADISTRLLLEQPDIYRAVIASLGAVSPVPSAVRPQSEALWALALGDGAGLTDATRLPEQLAFLFRGCVSFWIAGELADDALGAAFKAGACALMLGVAVPERRAFLLKHQGSPFGAIPVVPSGTTGTFGTSALDPAEDSRPLHT